MSSDDINKNLAKELEKWYKSTCTKWMGKPYKEIEKNFTEPFCTAVLDNYDKDKTIMFVGQETNGYGDINNFKKDVKQSIKDSQIWLKEFLTYNLKLQKPKEQEIYSQSKQEIPYKYYAFIVALRELSKKYNICWNNIDKIQYSKGVKLSVKDEKDLNSCKLLLKEIDIVKPDLIVFAIGPSYKKSLEFSTGLEVKDGEKPSLEKPIISGKIGDIPYLWTYHPRYYKFNIKNIEKEIEDIFRR